jgi:hypothetical protein
MRETEPKVTALKDKITISFNEKIRLGPLHTLVEGYLELNRDQQRQIEDLMESFLLENEIQQTYSRAPVSEKTATHLTEVRTKKDRILHIVKERANPNYLTAREIQDVYQQYLSESIGISTIQTNLNRLVDEGLVIRSEDSSPLEYCINPTKKDTIPKVLM